MNRLIFIALSLFVCNCISAQTEEKLYLFKADWSPAKSKDSAIYFMSVLKESDTLYTCRNYHIYGPMISWESYKDPALETAHGVFRWYNKEGNVDSAATYFNGQRISFDVIKKLVAKTELSISKISDSVSNIKKTDSVIQHPAEFQGGLKGWSNYLERNLKTPERLMNLSKNSMQYTVIASFLVEKNGELNNIIIEKTCEWSADNEFIRVLKNSPKWIPATQNSIPVAYRHRQSITFNVSTR